MIYQTRIIGRKLIAEHTFEVSFQRPPSFVFQAGQYIQLEVSKLMYTDPKGSSRVFSLASSPNDQKIISIAFRDSGSGFKRTIMELPIGTEIVIEGPHGFFTFPSNYSRPIVFVAGGIGITPYLSMISFATEKKLPQRIILLYANRDKESATYFDTLTSLEKQNPYLVMKNKFGLIDVDFLKLTIKEWSNAVWYVVGPPLMVTNTKEMLLGLAVNDDHIFIEEFIGYEPS